MQCSCEIDENDQVTKACLVHAEYAIQKASGEWIRAHEDQSYAAAAITFLNRDEHAAKRAMLYPIARVELLNVFNDRKPEIARAFTVSEGQWVEEQ